MQRSIIIIAAAAILGIPATAQGIPITVHEKVIGIEKAIDAEVVRGDPIVGIDYWLGTRVKETVVHRPPADEDDDGVADHEDDCVFCEPTYVRSSGTGGYSGDGETSSPIDGYYSDGYTIPESIVMCESGGDYGASNPSGAYGAYQIIPSTAAAYGCDLSYPAGQDACAAEIYADVGASAWDCG